MRGRAIEPDEKFHEGEIVESWSKTRVIVALLLFAGVVAAAYFGFTKVKGKAEDVLGAEANPKINTQDIKLPTPDDAQEIIERVKEELNSLTSNNFVSSQAAIQKIISDLEALQEGKGDPKDVICHAFCGK